MPRAIRRDVPLTNSIRRAYEAGTRDRTGRPGPNYWQLQTDYTINARLDPATQTITGTETIALHNNSPQELTEIVLRLDHNIFRGLVPRGTSVPAENTDGMVVTRHHRQRRGRRSAARRRRRRRRAADAADAAAAGAATLGGVGPRSDRRAHLARQRRFPPSRPRSSRSPGTRSCRAAPTAAATA